jgi:hypothetical protein
MQHPARSPPRARGRAGFLRRALGRTGRCKRPARRASRVRFLGGALEVGLVAGLRSYKPARRVRFPHLAPSSPIGGREPAFEAGDAGSIPARGTRKETHGGRCVLECTPRCERGSAGSIPAGHPIWGAPPNGGQLVLKTGVVVSSPRGSIPPLPSHAAATIRPVRLPARLPLFQGGEAGAAPARATARRFRLASEDAALSRRKRGCKSRTRRETPTASGTRPALRTQALEVRILPWAPTETLIVETCWSGNRPAR